MPNVVVVCGWLTVDGVKIARVCHQRLEFKDPDRRRAAARGSDVVAATASEIAQALQSAPAPTSAPAAR